MRTRSHVSMSVSISDITAADIPPGPSKYHRGQYQLTELTIRFGLSDPTGLSVDIHGAGYRVKQDGELGKIYVSLQGSDLRDPKIAELIDRYRPIAHSQLTRALAALAEA